MAKKHPLVEEYEELTKDAFIESDKSGSFEDEDTEVKRFMERVLGPDKSRWLRRMDMCFCDEDDFDESEEE